jgi:hypothetical protein
MSSSLDVALDLILLSRPRFVKSNDGGGRGARSVVAMAASGRSRVRGERLAGWSAIEDLLGR